MAIKLSKETLVKDVVELNPKNAKEVLMITSKMASEQHWKRKGINRLGIFFAVCYELGIDESDLS